MTDLEPVWRATTVNHRAALGPRFSARGARADPRHVPFIVKKAGQRERVDVTTAERGEFLLRQVVEAACGR